MPIFAPKACENTWFKARERASEFNDSLSSREGASEELGIERTRLARIETGISTPHADEAVMMAEVYNAPELRNYYCRECCPLGKGLPVVEEASIDRIGIRALSSMRKMGAVKEILLTLLEDGQIDGSEISDLKEVIHALDELAEINENLKCWATKNVEVQSWKG